MASTNPPSDKLATDVRFYGNRASYDLTAALSIMNDSPIVHVAFVAPAKKGVRETVMNLPLIAVVMRDTDGLHEFGDDEVEGYAVYLHT